MTRQPHKRISTDWIGQGLERRMSGQHLAVWAGIQIYRPCRDALLTPRWLGSREAWLEPLEDPIVKSFDSPESDPGGAGW